MSADKECDFECSELDWYVCRYCRRSYKHRQGLIDHKVREHSKLLKKERKMRKKREREQLLLLDPPCATSPQNEDTPQNVQISTPSSEHCAVEVESRNDKEAGGGPKFISEPMDMTKLPKSADPMITNSSSSSSSSPPPPPSSSSPDEMDSDPDPIAVRVQNKRKLTWINERTAKRLVAYNNGATRSSSSETKEKKNQKVILISDSSSDNSVQMKDNENLAPVLPPLNLKVQLSKIQKWNLATERTPYLSKFFTFHHEQNTMTCIICDKTVSVIAQAVNHLPSHTKQRDFKCSYCKNCFMHWITLQAHEQKFHSHKVRAGQKRGGKEAIELELELKKEEAAEKGYRDSNNPAPESDQKYEKENVSNKTESKTKRKLPKFITNKKMRVNGENVNVYSCNFCKKTSKYLCAISNHVRIHTGEHYNQPKGFTCRVCNKIFFNSKIKAHHQKQCNIPDCKESLKLRDKKQPEVKSVSTRKETDISRDNDANTGASSESLKFKDDRADLLAKYTKLQLQYGQQWYLCLLCENKMFAYKSTVLTHLTQTHKNEFDHPSQEKEDSSSSVQQK